MDTVTIGSTILTLVGFYAMFVSSKPVTFGGVIMSMVVSASATQAVIGVCRTMGIAETLIQPISRQPETQPDVLEGLGMALEWAKRVVMSVPKQEL